MDTLTAMRVFVAVVDAGGFSAASRTLGMPLPTVCRKIAELENHLGAQLLTRSTRKVTITDSGQSYYDDVRQVLDHIRDAESQVSGEYQAPRGRLAITAPTLFGRLHVLPIVNQFMQAHREVNVELLLSNHVIDLVEERINLGIRIGTLSDSSMIAIQVGSVRGITCASPAYLDQHGHPRSPKDLENHQCILFSKGGVPIGWRYKVRNKEIQFVPGHARLTVNSIQGIVDSVLQDMGLSQMYSYQVASHISDGALQVVLDQYETEPRPVNLIYPQGRFTPQKVRAFIDFAIPLLRDRLSFVDGQCKSTSFEN